jgi:excisionase family DNA binding protein
MGRQQEVTRGYDWRENQMPEAVLQIDRADLDRQLRIYQVSEARLILRLGRTTIYELIRTKQLRVLRAGRRILVPEDALREYLDSLPAERSEP